MCPEKWKKPPFIPFVIARGHCLSKCLPENNDHARQVYREKDSEIEVVEKYCLLYSLWENPIHFTNSRRCSGCIKT